jgi:hypothetical protein
MPDKQTKRTKRNTTKRQKKIAKIIPGPVEPQLAVAEAGCNQSSDNSYKEMPAHIQVPTRPLAFCFAPHDPTRVRRRALSRQRREAPRTLSFVSRLAPPAARLTASPTHFRVANNIHAQRRLRPFRRFARPLRVIVIAVRPTPNDLDALARLRRGPSEQILHIRTGRWLPQPPTHPREHPLQMGYIRRRWGRRGHGGHPRVAAHARKRQQARRGALRGSACSPARRRNAVAGRTAVVVIRLRCVAQHLSRGTGRAKGVGGRRGLGRDSRCK